MSRILIAPDSFKESLSATQVCKAIAEGLQSINPNVHLDQLPFSDGGEGAFELFEAALPARADRTLPLDLWCFLP